MNYTTPHSAPLLLGPPTTAFSVTANKEVKVNADLTKNPRNRPMLVYGIRFVIQTAVMPLDANRLMVKITLGNRPITNGFVFFHLISRRTGWHKFAPNFAWNNNGDGNFNAHETVSTGPVTQKVGLIKFPVPIYVAPGVGLTVSFYDKRDVEANLNLGHVFSVSAALYGREIAVSTGFRSEVAVQPPAEITLPYYSQFVTGWHPWDSAEWAEEAPLGSLKNPFDVQMRVHRLLGVGWDSGPSNGAWYSLITGRHQLVPDSESPADAASPSDMTEPTLQVSTRGGTMLTRVPVPFFHLFDALTCAWRMEATLPPGEALDAVVTYPNVAGSGVVDNAQFGVGLIGSYTMPYNAVYGR